MNSLHGSIEALASKATGTGSAVTVVSWFANFDWGLWTGIAIGAAGLAVNFYFKLRSDRRNQVAHAAYLKELVSGHPFRADLYPQGKERE